MPTDKLDSREEARSPYTRPRLTIFGTLKDLTAAVGGTAGDGAQGSAAP